MCVMQKKKIKKFDIYNKILNQPKIEGIQSPSHAYKRLASLKK